MSWRSGPPIPAADPIATDIHMEPDIHLEGYVSSKQRLREAKGQ